MKPYKNLSSHHLGPLLLLARVFIYLGVLFTIVSIVMLIQGLMSPTGLFGAVGGAVFLPWALMCFTLSGIFAAIVAFEENHRLSVDNKKS